MWTATTDQVCPDDQHDLQTYAYSRIEDWEWKEISRICTFLKLPCYGMAHVRHGQTDRQTDRRTDIMSPTLTAAEY